LERALGNHDEQTLTTRSELFKVLISRRDLEAAAAELESITEGSAGREEMVVPLLIMLADRYQRQGLPDLAVHQLHHAVTVTEAVHGKQALQLPKILRLLSDALAAAGDADEAILVLTRLQGLHDWYGAHDTGVADDLRMLADLLVQQGRAQEALPHLRWAIDIDRRHHQRDLAPLIQDLTTASTLLDQTGDHQQARTLRAELARLSEGMIMTDPRALCRLTSSPA
jgi:tetratricopeptide (TPR) repeat protein